MLEFAKRQSYENQYRFILQTGLRTGELVGLQWSDIDFESRTMQINRSMEYRHSAQEWRIGEPKSKSGYRTRDGFSRRCFDCNMMAPQMAHYYKQSIEKNYKIKEF